jgi:succinyl-diaminopimelate desuccinylase
VKTPVSKMAKIIEEREPDLRKLCSELIQAKSENPPGDVSEAVDVIDNFLKEERVVHQHFEPEKGHISVIATVGKGKPSLILCGHTDVVPAGDLTEWKVPPYEGKIKGGKLYGRGATDQKGGVAAMLMALAVVKDFEDELCGKVTVASVSDEEDQGPGGTLWLLQNKKLTGDACLITEPTGFLGGEYSITAGERGTCWLKIIAHGKPAHGSTPALGLNAIEMLTQFLPKLKTLESEAVATPRDAEALISNGEKEQRRLAQKHRIPPKSLTRALTHYSVSLGVISGGTKTNVVPERCEAEIDVRVPAGGHPEGVEEFVRCILPEKMEYQVINKTLPSHTRADQPLIKAIQKSARQVFGYTPIASYIPATCDAHFFRELLNIPAVSFGPGYDGIGHTCNEFVYMDDVKNAAKVYANVIGDFLTEKT